MGPSELMQQVADVLESMDIPYLVTGSMATIAYGEPRFTNDVDGVLKVQRERIDRDYIALWAERLQLAEEWETVLAREAAE